MDEPSDYGFPTYGEATVKAAQDRGVPIVTGDDRSGGPDEAMRERLSAWVRNILPGSGRPSRSKHFLYTYDLKAFRLDRPALTDPSYVANWMV